MNQFTVPAFAAASLVAIAASNRLTSGSDNSDRRERRRSRSPGPYNPASRRRPVAVPAFTANLTNSGRRDRRHSRSPRPYSYTPGQRRPPSHTERTPMASSGRYDESRRAELKRIAEETLQAIAEGMYPHKGIDYQIRPRLREAAKHTKFYGPDLDAVSLWATSKLDTSRTPSPSQISVLHISTLDAARLLDNAYKNFPKDHGNTTGVLNFASATKPGGGFKNGAEAQEESIARSSTLFHTLVTDEGAKFYKLHSRESAQNSAAYYSHAMIYSPKVTVFRDDDGVWTYPFEVDVLSCAAVNAGELRKALNGPITAGLEVTIEKEMAERMGRILYLFEQHGVRNLVLGTFGTGVFRNNVATVARIWAQLLITPEARFKDSFDRIIFAITGDETFAEFQSAFDAWGQTRAPARSSNGRGGGLVNRFLA